MLQTGLNRSRFGLEQHGLRNLIAERWNDPTPVLYEEALRRNEGVMAEGGALVVRTGDHTGRSANDKFIVREPTTEGQIWWGAVNKPFEPERFDALRRRMLNYFEKGQVYVQDCWAGADPEYRLAVRVITESAWHALFARNMFRAPTAEELTGFEPGFTVLHAPGFTAKPERDGTRSDVFILVNFAERMVLIGGTSYAGEIKKSIFSILNHLLPERDVLPMHCSANVGPKGDSAIFFGLSGTGKTTLSADPRRALIGDDEHGWSAHGLFNFEGGCYAKVIRLSPEAEPEIYATTRMFGTVLENVVVDPYTRRLDLDDASLTENTRASYPIDFIPNASPTGQAAHPANLLMLTADAFGVLPPIARLTPAQAMFHFLSGYTAKLAGTEKGLGREPQATFSTCFGAPFMPRHPSVYARMLGEKIARHRTACWLVNTGWTGGAYGTGHRMPIAHTRALVNAALDGSLAEVPTRTDPNFGFQVPVACPGVPEEVLNPRNTWADKAAYDAKARELVTLFNENFKQFADHVDPEVRAAAPAKAA
jgi:phosphoenolpyruvate carboxykinase (ATP)